MVRPKYSQPHLAEYHPESGLWEITDSRGKLVGILSAHLFEQDYDVIPDSEGERDE